ncbi:MAG: glycosyl hydrolase family 28 protein, partial [Limisphaerales bacterium]
MIKLPSSVTQLAFAFFASTVFADVPLPTINTNYVIIVTHAPFDARGDNATINTGAIQAAINAAAGGGTTNGLIGGTVEIPASGAYLCGPLNYSNNVNLQVDAGAILRMLPYGSWPGGITNPSSFLNASHLTNIELSGSGAIDGQGAAWWPGSRTNSRAVMISWNSCRTELIQNITLSNSPMFHIAIGGSAANTTVRGVTVYAPGNSPNTDACDVSGTNILVENCNISEGDDDYTCGGGTHDVLLTNNTYGTGHGISIGSYTDGGVSNITVINCTMNGTANGIRIKSDDGRGGLVQNISYENISMTNVNFPIQIYAYYLEIGTPSGITPYDASTQAVAAVTGSTPIYRNITFSNITATAVSGYPAAIIWARTEAPATNIVFKKVNIRASRPFEIYNGRQVTLSDCVVTQTQNSNTLSMFNAQVTVTNSVPSASLLTLDGVTGSGYGNSFGSYNATESLKNTNGLADGALTLGSGTFTVSNDFSMPELPVFNFQLGSAPATVIVKGNLTLGGTVNVASGDGFAEGTYPLFTYAGTLTGSTPVLGTVPAGYSYRFDTSTAGLVNLVVSGAATQPPPAPDGVAATAGNDSVMLSWSPSATATSYHVKRATVSGGESVTNATVTATNYTDTQVTNGVTYYYVVSAVNSLGQSPDSSEVSATPQSPVFIVATTNLLSDNFSASSVNSTDPAAATSASTSYETVSSKSWSPAPSIGPGDLRFGIPATTSGSMEAQARLSNPATLAAPGDNVSLMVTFTDTAGLLTSAGAMGFGFYQSDQDSPVPGGLDATATTSYTDYSTGYAQHWEGYVAQLAYTGGNCQIMTRPAQTTGSLYNNDQDLVTSGSGSSSYDYPSGTTVGAASTGPSVTLAAGNPYTDFLTITLSAANTLAITNTLYSGAGTNGPLLSQLGGVASGATYVTNVFDALAIG